MQKQPVVVAIVLTTGLLVGFQNCGQDMMAAQAFQNDEAENNKNIPEQFEDDLSKDAAQIQQALKGSGSASALAICSPSDFRFRWPLGGVSYADWMNLNYVDLNPTGGLLKDYRGNTGGLALTYDGHRGTDIIVPSFRYM